ncbi:dephospho-CoA kinase [Arcanobacterium bovis]|uniref:Dephospho-CoA kinase n=2 Tax=Arcanobacterium bovis TaxID=2529275 RepID=A0A4Q9V0T1_9ACTO|nr:dephospho-CoA kinase [Arcanobacterium bovis]
MKETAKRLHDLLGLRTSPGIFFGSAFVVILFTALMAIFPGPVQKFFGHLATFIRYDLGWFFTLSVTLLVIFSLVLAASRYGRIKIGDDDSKPEYSGVAWFGMLFAAGVGAVLMFWGIAEPMTHYAKPPLEGTAAFSDRALSDAMAIANFHFTLHMWAIFVVPGLAFGYFTYKRKLPPRVSSAFQPLLGDGIHGPVGKIIDILAIVATVFGLSVSVGFGALQINSGANYVLGVPVAPWVQALILAIITGVALGSVIAGMDKGVKRLSYINIVLATILMIFVLLFGSTMGTMRAMVESIGGYISHLPTLSFFNDLGGNGQWSGQWTVFYWAWTVTWAPFVGMFVAKISKGRTIREFVLGTMGVPSIFVMIWMAIYGYNAVVQDRASAPTSGTGGALAKTIVDEGNVQAALFQFLHGFPWYQATAVLALVVVLLFFITSIDSGALVMDAMANGHEDLSPLKQRVFWGLSIGGVCASILLTAGENGLTALQEVIIVVGFPVVLMTFVQMLMVIQALREDAGAAKPIRTRQWKRVLPAEEYERRAEDPDEDVEGFVISPEFEPGTEPEFETHTPTTAAVLEAQAGMPKLRIAVTGGAAAGASLVADELAKLGAVVIDADEISRDVLTNDEQVQDEIRAVFGEDIVSADGEVDRSALGRLVFASREARLRLEEIMHPRIIDEIDRISREIGEESVAVVTVPLLVESGLASRFDQVITVSAPVERRVERLMEEKGLSREDAWARLDTRITDEEREEVADYVLHNDDDIESLRAATREYWDEHVAPSLNEV